MLKKEIQKSWFDFLDQVHKTLQKIGLERVETPTLVECPGTEVDLDFFEVPFSEKTPTSSVEKLPTSFTKNSKHKPHSTENPEVKKLFLASSPEMYLKRMLCAGWTDIYEIKKCFRKEESTHLNQPEFYLLEWYRSHSGLDTLIADLQTLLNTLAPLMKPSPTTTATATTTPTSPAPTSTAALATATTAPASPTSPPTTTTATPATATTTPASPTSPKIEKISMKTLFRKHIDMNITPRSSKKDFQQELKKRNIPFSEEQDINDAFHLLFLNAVEPCLNKDIPTVVYNFPPFQKAYARIGSEGWALRFELFWKGMELANAFDEVIDAKEQEKCFREDNLKRHQKGKPIIPLDFQLLDAMQKKQMPPSAGIALGLDRLFLALKGLNNIKQIRFFT